MVFGTQIICAQRNILEHFGYAIQLCLAKFQSNLSGLTVADFFLFLPCCCGVIVSFPRLGMSGAHRKDISLAISNLLFVTLPIYLQNPEYKATLKLTYMYPAWHAKIQVDDKVNFSHPGLIFYLHFHSYCTWAS